MGSLQRFQFSGHFLEVYAERSKENEGSGFSFSFNSNENFHEIVKRLARTQTDDQVKLAYYALEGELGDRQK